MTFGYIGYIWAILACSLFALVVVGSGALLYAIGRRADRGRPPRPVVDSLPIVGRDHRVPLRGSDHRVPRSGTPPAGGTPPGGAREPHGDA